VKKLIVTLFLFGFIFSAFCEDQITQVNGKKIILHDNGTWEYFATSNTNDETIIRIDKSPLFDKTIKSKKWSYAISYNSSKWDLSTNPDGAPSEYQFTNKENTGYGMCIYDGLSINLESMKKVLIVNASKMDPNASIINVQKSIVNGITGEFVTYCAESSGIMFYLYTFIATKETGTIQFTFYTTKEAFEKLKPSFEEAISGIDF
jgi:hypothetical protein